MDSIAMLRTEGIASMLAIATLDSPTVPPALYTRHSRRTRKGVLRSFARETFFYALRLQGVAQVPSGKIIHHH